MINTYNCDSDSFILDQLYTYFIPVMSNMHIDPDFSHFDHVYNPDTVLINMYIDPGFNFIFYQFILI